MSDHDMIKAIARGQYTRPVTPANQVVQVVRNADGSMTCNQASGESFTIPAGETVMQAFVAFTMIHRNEL